MNKNLAIALIAIVAINGIIAAPPLDNLQAKCVPWLGRCQQTSECCRNLVCLFYAAKCVPGNIWNDDRPIGDGPYPPKKQWLNAIDLDSDDNALAAETKND